MFKPVLLGLLLYCLSWQVVAIDWYVRDWPPFNIQQGPDAGQGSYDLMLAKLTAALPQYSHRLQFATLAKRQQLMQQNVPHCLFGVLKSPERQKRMLFSDIAFYSPALRVAALAEHPLWQSTQASAHIELASLLRQAWRGLVEYKRLYPQNVQQYAGELLQVSDNSTDLVAMLKANRADYVVEYPDRLHYLAQRHPSVALRYARLQGEPPVVPVYVACQNTPAAAAQMKDINLALQQLRSSADYQQAWLHLLSEQSRQELRLAIAQDPMFHAAAPTECGPETC